MRVLLAELAEECDSKLFHKDAFAVRYRAPRQLMAGTAG